MASNVSSLPFLSRNTDSALEIPLRNALQRAEVLHFSAEKKHNYGITYH